MNSTERYEYRAYDASGRQVIDTVRVSDPSEINEHLASRNLVAVSIRKAETGWKPFRPKFRKEKILFYQELLSYRRNNIPASETRRDLVELFPLKSRFRPIVDGVLQDIESEGRKTWEAMQRRDDVFQQSEIELMRVAHGQGQEVEMLGMLVAFLKRSDTIMRKIANASVYPTILSIGGVVAVTVFATVMLPQLVSLYKELDIEPVFPIPQLMYVMDAFSHPITQIPALLIVAGLIAGITAWARTPKGAIGLDRAFMNLPLFGRMIFTGRLVKSLFVLQLMYDAGQRSSAFAAAHAAAEGAVFRKSLGRISYDLAEANVTKWDDAMALEPSVFDKLLVGIVRSGEKNGVLAEKLKDAIDMKQIQIDEMIATFPEKMQAAITGIFTVIVGFLLYAMVVPTSSAIAHLH
jgi:type IV pilus assembly protein PilC